MIGPPTPTSEAKYLLDNGESPFVATLLCDEHQTRERGSLGCLPVATIGRGLILL